MTVWSVGEKKCVHMVRRHVSSDQIGVHWLSDGFHD